MHKGSNHPFLNPFCHKGFFLVRVQEIIDKFTFIRVSLSNNWNAVQVEIRGIFLNKGFFH